jgi:hypothetical protein
MNSFFLPPVGKSYAQEKPLEGLHPPPPDVFDSVPEAENRESCFSG